MSFKPEDAVTILVNGDSCELNAWGVGVKGLSPEQAVKLRELVIYGFRQGARHFNGQMGDAMHKLVRELDPPWEVTR